MRGETRRTGRERKGRGGVKWVRVTLAPDDQGEQVMELIDIMFQRGLYPLQRGQTDSKAPTVSSIFLVDVAR